MSRLRRAIVTSLVGSGVLLIATVFCGSLWLLLGCLGDESGAVVALGTASMTAAGFLGTQFLLITLLALTLLQKNMDRDALSEKNPHA